MRSRYSTFNQDPSGIQDSPDPSQPGSIRIHQIQANWDPSGFTRSKPTGLHQDSPDLSQPGSIRIHQIQANQDPSEFIRSKPTGIHPDSPDPRQPGSIRIHQIQAKQDPSGFTRSKPTGTAGSAPTMAPHGHRTAPPLGPPTTTHSHTPSPTTHSLIFKATAMLYIEEKTPG